jgi:hypothetical protein
VTVTSFLYPSVNYMGSFLSLTFRGLYKLIQLSFYCY